jgi:hypothetical protein
MPRPYQRTVSFLTQMGITLFFPSSGLAVISALDFLGFVCLVVSWLVRRASSNGTENRGKH